VLCGIHSYPRRVEAYIHPADRPAAQIRREYVAMYLAVWVWLRCTVKLHTSET